MDQTVDLINISNVKPIRDIVYENLRKAIMEGKLKPGERIVEKDFADKMKISRTPIREAIRKLEIEGLVQYIPRKGVVVNDFCVEDIVEIYAIRKSLEGLSMKYAIKRISEKDLDKLRSLVEKMELANAKGEIETVFEVCKEFNETILHATKMPRLIGLISMLQEYLERFRRITMSNTSRREHAIHEHGLILQAIIDKDIKKAEELVRQHLDGSEKVFLEQIMSQ